MQFVRGRTEDGKNTTVSFDPNEMAPEEVVRLAMMHAATFAASDKGSEVLRATAVAAHWLQRDHKGDDLASDQLARPMLEEALSESFRALCTELDRFEKSTLELLNIAIDHARRHGTDRPEDWPSVPSVDGMLFLDAILASHLENIGALGKCYATLIRKDSIKRWKNRDISYARDLFRLWTVPQNIEGDADGVPKFVASTIEALWDHNVRPSLEKARAKELVPVRMPTDLSHSMAIGRAFGAVAQGTRILVEPPSGFALMLPFDEDFKVTRRGTADVVSLRGVLSPAALQTYLSTLVLYQDAGSREDGSFEAFGPEDAILDMTGAKKHEERKGSKSYFRYATKTRKAVRSHLETFSKMRVRVVGDLEAAGGDPLLDEIRDRRTGKTVTLAHSRLVAANVRTNYTRIPRAVCKLAAGDVPLAIGLATVIRRNALAYLKNDKPIEKNLGEWLAACGINGAEGARQEGRAFWSRVVDELARVAKEGGLGTIKKAGTGQETVLTIQMHEDLAESYSSLLDGSKRQERAKRAAMVADHRRKPRKPGT